MNDMCGVVYKVPCNNCSDSYIGKTGRNFGTRINEHKNNVKNLNTNSLIFSHVLENDHSIDWNHSSILAHSSHQKPRQFLEAVYTKTQDGAYNRSNEIPEIYIPLIESIVK